MRALAFLVLLVPSLALARGPSITRVTGGSAVQDPPACPMAWQLPGSYDGAYTCDTSPLTMPVTTTRASGATCIGGHTVAANVPCIGTYGLESFAAGTGGRTAADVHTVSTAGWPVAKGRICIQYTPLVTVADTRALLDTTSGAAGYLFYIASDRRPRLLVNGTATASVDALPFVGGTPQQVCVDWRDGTISFTADGASIGSTSGRAMPTGPLPATARIGNNVASTLPANGSIRLLRVSE